MALSVTRGVAITTVVCATVAVAYLPPSPRGSEGELSQRDRIRARHSRLREQLRAAETRLRVLERYDTLQEATSVGDGGASFASGELPAAWREWFQTGVERIRAAAERRPSVVEVVVLVTTDTAHWRSRSFVFPGAAVAGRCIALTTLGSWAAGTTPRRVFAFQPARRSRPDLLGPCAFYREFGIPGPYVQNWLRAGGWTLVQHLHWPDSLSDRLTLPDWQIADVLSSRVPWLVGCIAGHADDCRRWMLNPDRPVLRSPVAGGSDIAHERGLGTRVLADLGARLVDEFGRDAFRRFWTAKAPMDSAFTAAFGVAVGAWTRGWMQRHVQWPAARRVQGASVPLSLAFVVLCLGAAVMRIVRRQV